jgi:small subunit ribosomal protein S33
MSAKKTAAKVSELAIQQIRRDIFGHAPVLNMRSGFQELKKPYTGTYIARYYFDNHMDDVARKCVPGYTTDLQDRRATKLFNLRRRGKGPPKKGSGKRSKK